MAPPYIKVTAEHLLGELNEAERKYAPKALWVSGQTSIFDVGTRVSIVGTRSPSERGERQAHDLATVLAHNGVVVVSGLAKGIDTVAHKAAMAVPSGRTIAVLGTPLDRCYPAENRELQEEIAERHAVVSQFTPGSSPHQGSFPMRNRTMALLSDATIIVEAGERSGTIHQGWEAIRIGRPLFLMDTLIESGKFAWISELEKYGAEPISIDVIPELLSYLPARSQQDEELVALFG